MQGNTRETMKEENKRERGKNCIKQNRLVYDVLCARRENFIWWGLHRIAINMHSKNTVFFVRSFIRLPTVSFCHSPSLRVCCWCLLSINRFVHFQSMWMWNYFSGFQWGIKTRHKVVGNHYRWISTYTFIKTIPYNCNWKIYAYRDVYECV